MAYAVAFYTPVADPPTPDRRKESNDEKNKKKAAPLERHVEAVISL